MTQAARPYDAGITRRTFIALSASAPALCAARTRPSTLDLRVPVTRAVECIIHRMDPAMNYRPWFAVEVRHGRPVRLRHDRWDFGDTGGRFVESLVLARRMARPGAAAIGAEGHARAFFDDSPNLYQNNRGGAFVDRVFQAGLGRERSFLGWGVIFADFDNDGWSDILMVNGHLSRDIDTGKSDSRYAQRKLFYRNQGGGRFEDLSLALGPDLPALHSSRGAATADFLNDGRLAVAVNEMNEPPSFLVAQSPSTNHWIGIQAVGTKSNRDAIGARVEVRGGSVLLIDEVRSGGSYNSQNDLRLHFGLGPHDGVDCITVRWPSGGVDRFENVRADRHIRIEEGSRAISASVFRYRGRTQDR